MLHINSIIKSIGSELKDEPGYTQGKASVRRFLEANRHRNDLENVIRDGIGEAVEAANKTGIEAIGTYINLLVDVLQFV